MRLPTQLSPRKKNTHKGDYGHVFVLGGCARLSTAPVLAAEAALHSGAGLVTIGIPCSLNNAIIKIKAKEAMTLPLPQTKEETLSLKAENKIIGFLKNADVLAIGPGLSLNPQSSKLALKLIYTVKKKMVIDADALNALSLDFKKFREIKVITPHPKEMARLLGVSAEAINKNRKEVAKRLACDYNCIVVLKGHKTIVVSPCGRIYINHTGNPGMAKAGTGDVLTGIIAAFLAQGLSDFEASKYGVYLHGLAGDLAAKEKTEISMLASDIIDMIPKAMKKCS
ncbi:MAG: NAD(P)H-hydrate dehydratase [Candidatus Omnitrophica bacterium]|jgi:NAD(P)H-hydrate epimerase|nr:NAD(P)H-hydrate dehydratase [Candidatus Omnitrophota bacterium]